LSVDVFETVGSFYKRTVSSDTLGEPVGRILHCLNPFPVKPATEHERAQSITLRSIRYAKQVTAATAPNLRIEHVAAILQSDNVQTELEFDHRVQLTRSVSDFQKFKIHRDLPLLYDIITSAPANPNDIIIFTNVDISIVPTFYLFIENIFRRGCDCVVVNRRTISDVYSSESDIHLMSAEVGTKHPGHDCFALRASLLKEFVPFQSCVGIAGAARPLLYNVLAYARAPTVLMDAHVTFHIGDDKTWRNKDFDDYTTFNRRELDRVVNQLLKDKPTRIQLINRLNSPVGQTLMSPVILERLGVRASKQWASKLLLHRVLRRLWRT